MEEILKKTEIFPFKINIERILKIWECNYLLIDIWQDSLEDVIHDQGTHFIPGTEFSFVLSKNIIVDMIIEKVEQTMYTTKLVLFALKAFPINTPYKFVYRFYYDTVCKKTILGMDNIYPIETEEINKLGNELNNAKILAAKRLEAIMDNMFDFQYESVVIKAEIDVLWDIIIKILKNQDINLNNKKRIKTHIFIFDKENSKDYTYDNISNKNLYFIKENSDNNNNNNNAKNSIKKKSLKLIVCDFNKNDSNLKDSEVNCKSNHSIKFEAFKINNNKTFLSIKYSWDVNVSLNHLHNIQNKNSNLLKRIKNYFN